MKKLILTFGIVLVSQFGFAQTNAAKPAAEIAAAPVDEAFKKDVLRVKNNKKKVSSPEPHYKNYFFLKLN